MSISDVMTPLMDSVRSITNTSDKLSIADATSILKKPTLMTEISSDPNTYWPNLAEREKTGDLSAKFTSNTDGSNMGCYIPDISKMGFEKYIFECSIRGTLPLYRFGIENNLVFAQVVPNETTWQRLRIPFLLSTSSAGVFDIYGKGSKGQWIELDHPCFIKVGGGNS